MSKQLLGVHHITAICGDPQQNVDFYSGVLGLRLVKKTVNFDDPGTYHLYYGDGAGRPGTILTFFPWPHAGRGRQGTGQVTSVAFAIPQGSEGYWRDRLTSFGIPFEHATRAFGSTVLSLADPDGMAIELVVSEQVDPEKAFAGGHVPVEYAIHGFAAPTLSERNAEKTELLLTEVLGFRLAGREGSRARFELADGGAGATVDVLSVPQQATGRVAVGSVHHIAWRTADDAQQAEWLQELTSSVGGVSPVMDRKYFHSIYFREPGNILFEIATDLPGFAVDEPAEQLGESLVLPRWLEPAREKIEAVLPPIAIPYLREVAAK